MSNEINLTAAITAFKPSAMATALSRALNGLQYSMNGNFFVQINGLFTNTATALPMGQVTGPHWAFLYSNPLFNTVPQQAATTITGAANNGSGLVRITDTAHGYLTGDVVTIAGVGGTNEANGTWPVTVITANTFDLVGSAYANAYTSGGTAVLNNSIRVRNGASGADFLQLFPGEFFMGPLLVGSVPYVVSNQAGQLLEGFVLSY